MHSVTSTKAEPEKEEDISLGKNLSVTAMRDALARKLYLANKNTKLDLQQENKFQTAFNT